MDVQNVPAMAVVGQLADQARRPGGGLPQFLFMIRAQHCQFQGILKIDHWSFFRLLIGKSVAYGPYSLSENG